MSLTELLKEDLRTLGKSGLFFGPLALPFFSSAESLVIIENIDILLFPIYAWMQLILYVIVEPYHNSELRHQNKIALHDECSWEVSALTAQGIEYFILNRYSFFGYKNAVRANLRLFASLGLTFFVISFFSFIFSIFRIDETNGNTSNLTTLWMACAGLFLSSFILERRNLHEKWQYLASLYNSIIEADLNRKFELEYAFAMDLIDMEMWSHRSFREMFTRLTIKAYPISTDEFELTEKEILKVLTKQELNKQKAYSYLNIAKINLNNKEGQRLLGVALKKVI